MKILQINSHYNQGGAARIVACIHRQLLQQGEESYVAYGRGKVSAEQNVCQFGGIVQEYVSALVSRIFGIHGWCNKGATKRLIAYMDQVKPDVVHLHAVHGYYLNLPMVFDYLNKYNIPCVWTFHDCFAFTGNCGYYFQCEKWKSGCGNCPNIHNYPNSLWFDHSGWMWKRKKELFTAGGAKVIVSPSQWLTDEAKKSFFGKYECVTVRNGIEAGTVFYPRDRKVCREKYGYSMEENLVLGIAVGYDDVRKGAKYIIQLAKDLEKEAKVILIGWNEKNNNMLEGVTNVVTLPNTSSTEMLAEYYSMADVFVIPSLAENYATVTLESMACGTPAVGFQAGGIPEQLTEGKGIAVETGNQQQFDNAVRTVLQARKIWENGGHKDDKVEPEVTLLFGQELAQVIREENSTLKMTKEYLKIYRQLMQ